MDDDEIQVIEVTVRTGSPVKKRKRRESLPQEESSDSPSNNDMVNKAVQLKRRLAFCEKEQEELSKRFKAIKDQLTEEQSCQLDVKLENSNEHEPVICVGDSSDDDVIFVLPEDYSPLKRRKLDDANKAETFDSNADQPKKDVAITYYKPATNLPHARENCTVHKFVQSNVTTSTVSCNESYCGQCYCYVCDAPVKECDSWKTGTNPHCNGYGKNAFWEKLRKMAKRKTSVVQDSLLKCLPADEQTESLQAAAVKATELLETLKDEIDGSGASNFRPSSPCCDCECHAYDSDDSYGGYREEGCRWCYDEHESRMCAYDLPFGRYGGGWAFSLSSNVSNTVSKATDYLKNDQPAQAAIVLDALTVLLLAADNDRNRWSFSQLNAALKSLRKAWIEVLMHADLPSNLEVKVRGRLKNAIDGALICSPESTGLKMILEMKKWNDESLVKCLAGTLGDDFITEDEEVAEARLAFLEKSKRFSDALYYMLGCKVTQKNRNFPMLNSTSQQQLTNITIYRHKFILLLAKTGKIDQALNVSTVPGTVNLDKDVLTNTTPKEVGINVNYSQCALASMSYSDMTVLLTAIVNDGSSAEAGNLSSPQIIPETKLKKVLAVILTGAQINSSLRTDTALEWYINTFCESSLSNNLSKDVRQQFIKGAEQLLDKAKNKILVPSDITPPFKGPFKVFVVELLAALAVRVYVLTSYYQLYSITNTMGVFKKKGLPWACVSMVLSSTITEKISPQMLGFVLDNVIKPLGSSCIPLKVYESWIKMLPDMYGIEKNYEIAQFILKEKRKPGTDQDTNDAMVLVKKIVETIESVLYRGTNWNKEKLTAVLKKMKKDFPSGHKDLRGKILGLSFKCDPSYTNFENVRNACKQENWPQLRETMINFLKKHRTSHTACCIDVFGQCFMFNEIKQTLAACSYVNSYPTVCDKIKQTLSKLKKDDACRLADACADWLGKTLCNGAFQKWRSGYKFIPDAMLSCLKAIADVQIQTFNDILSAAIRNAVNIFDNKTVQVRNRSDLERWLQDIKELYRSKNQMKAWSWTFHEITTGRLRRKPAVIRQLTNSTGLLKGNIPYSQLVKMQAASTTATNSSSSKTAASKYAVNASTSTATNTTRVKPASWTATSKPAMRATASTPTNTTSTKPAQGTVVSKQAVNMAASTSTNISTGYKPAQGTAVSKQAVNMAASTSTNISTGYKPAQGTAVSKQAVNMARSTPTNISTAKPVQQAVRTITSTPTNAAGSKPTQGSAAKGAVNTVPSTPTNPPTAKPAQGMTVPKQVASTPRDASRASTFQGTHGTPRSARASGAPNQPTNTIVSTTSNTQSAKPSSGPSSTVNASRIGMQRPVVPTQPANFNKTVLVSNSIALNQQLAQIITSTNRLLAVRVPPGTANLPAATPPVGTFVAITPSPSTTSSVARASSTVQTTVSAVVSTSSTTVSSARSTGSLA